MPVACRPVSRSLVRDLRAQVGARLVLDRSADLAAYAFDATGASGERRLPEVVVLPGSTDEVARAVRVCAGHGVPVVPRGAGSGYAGGAVPVDGGAVVSLSRMRRVLGIHPEAMRMRVEAGVVTGDVHRRALQSGLYYPPDPGSATTCTIGGNVACNAAGPHTLRYGTTADHLVGATAVLADGQIVHLGEGGGGGTDLLRLLCGSEGTLAIVTEAALRLLPAPASRSTLAASFTGMDTAATAVAALSAAGLVPAAVEFLDDAALRAVARSGVDAYAPQAGALLLLELEGEAPEVAAELDAALSAIATGSPDRIETATDPAAQRRLWAARKAISAAVATVMIGKVNEDVVVPRDRVAELVATVRAIGDRRSVPVVNFGHLGDGNLHATFLIDPRRPGDRARGDAAAGELFETVLGMGGALTGEHGVGSSKLPYVERQLGPGTVELMRRLKASLDPRGLLNPAKKVPELAAGSPR
jgi:glycolate oxidase subunit GlcD